MLDVNNQIDTYKEFHKLSLRDNSIGSDHA